MVILENMLKALSLVRRLWMNMTAVFSYKKGCYCSTWKRKDQRKVIDVHIKNCLKIQCYSTL